MAARGIEAGRAFVRVGVDLSALSRGLKQISAKVASAGRSFMRVGAGAAAIGTAILAPIAAAIRQFTTFGDALDKMSARTGVGVGALSELGFAAEQGGSNLETLERGLNGLSRSLYDASRGSGEAVAALKALGLEYADLEGQSPEDQLQRIGDQLTKVQDATLRGALAQKLLGRSGRELLPMLATLREVRDEARALGFSLDKDATDNAAKLADAFNRIKRTLGGALLQVGAALAEPLLKVLDVITTITVMAAKLAKQNWAVFQATAAIGAAFLAIAAVAIPIGILLLGISAGITALIGAFGFLVSAIIALLNPITLVLNAFSAWMVYTNFDAITNAISSIGGEFKALAGDVGTAWGGISAAISTGRLEKAAAIAFTLMEIGWLTVTSRIQAAWTKAVNGILLVASFMQKSILDVAFSISGAFAAAWDTMVIVAGAVFDKIYIWGANAFDRLAGEIAKFSIHAKKQLGFLSAEQAVKITAKIDEITTGRRERREQVGASRRGTRQAQADKNRQDRIQFRDTLDDDFRRKQDGFAKKFVEPPQLDAANKRLAALRAKLAKQVDDEIRFKRTADAIRPDKTPPLPTLGAVDALQGQSSGSVGTFVSGVAGRIAGGGTSKLEDQGDQQIDLLGSIDARLRVAGQQGGLN